MSENESTEDASFEQALKRLEHLVNEMEDGSLSLDRMITHFEEGSKLVGLCEKKLNEVEQKIDQLVKDGEAIKTEPVTDNISPDKASKATGEP